jgi:D-alanine--poly(phosphoribitol) ligase subunit 2
LPDPDTIVERLGALFARSFHIDVPTADTDLLASGMLDSLQLVELLLQLEQQFGLRITIDDIDLDDLRTVRRIASVVAKKSDPGRPYPVNAEESVPLPDTAGTSEARARAPQRKAEVHRDESKESPISVTSLAGEA